MPGKQAMFTGLCCVQNGIQERSLHMFNDIFVGVMIVVALGAGVWCWWFENIEPKEKNTEDEGKKK